MRSAGSFDRFKMANPKASPERSQATPMLRTLALSLTLAILAAPVRAADRNIVFFVADDHGAEALGASGNRVAKTPNLDALAAEGVRFSHAFGTTASCSTSQSVLLTGVHNHRNGQYGHEPLDHHFSAFPNVRTWRSCSKKRAIAPRAAGNITSRL